MWIQDSSSSLSASEKAVLMNELCCTVDDLLLVIKVNSEWINLNGQQLADNLLDSVACFEMGEHRQEKDVVEMKWQEDVIGLQFGCMDKKGCCHAATHRQVYSSRQQSFIMVLIFSPFSNFKGFRESEMTARSTSPDRNMLQTM